MEVHLDDIDGSQSVIAAPRILCYGASCVDFILGLHTFPTPDEKLRCDNSQMQGGGNAGNTCGTMYHVT
jgi:hypothetical protein